MKRHFALVVVCLLVLVKSSHQKWSCPTIDTSNEDTLDNCLAMAVAQVCAMYQNVTGIMNKLSPDGQTKIEAFLQKMEEKLREMVISQLEVYLNIHSSDPDVQNFMQDNLKYPALLHFMGFQIDEKGHIKKMPNTQAPDFCNPPGPGQFLIFLTNVLTSNEKKVLLEALRDVVRRMNRNAPEFMSTLLVKNVHTLEFSEQDFQILQTYFLPLMEKAIWIFNPWTNK